MVCSVGEKTTVTNNGAEEMKPEVFRRYRPLSVHPLFLHFH